MSTVHQLLRQLVELEDQADTWARRTGNKPVLTQAERAEYDAWYARYRETWEAAKVCANSAPLLYLDAPLYDALCAFTDPEGTLININPGIERDRLQAAFDDHGLNRHLGLTITPLELRLVDPPKPVPEWHPRSTEHARR